MEFCQRFDPTKERVVTNRMLHTLNIGRATRPKRIRLWFSLGPNPAKADFRYAGRSGEVLAVYEIEATCEFYSRVLEWK